MRDNMEYLYSTVWQPLLNNPIDWGFELHKKEEVSLLSSLFPDLGYIVTSCLKHLPHPLIAGPRLTVLSNCDWK